MATDPGRWRRIAIVTLALAGIGAVVGGVVGALLVGVLLAGLDHVQPSAFLLLMGARFGAGVGFVLAPVAAWTLMRRVPLWRAIGETAIGTAVGAGLGLVLQTRISSVAVSPMILGVAGFALAALRLRLFYRAPAAKTPRDDLHVR